MSTREENGAPENAAPHSEAADASGIQGTLGVDFPNTVAGSRHAAQQPQGDKEWFFRLELDTTLDADQAKELRQLLAEGRRAEAAEKLIEWRPGASEEEKQFIRLGMGVFRRSQLLPTGSLAGTPLVEVLEDSGASAPWLAAVRLIYDIELEVPNPGDDPAQDARNRSEEDLAELLLKLNKAGPCGAAVIEAFTRRCRE